MSWGNFAQPSVKKHAAWPCLHLFPVSLLYIPLSQDKILVIFWVKVYFLNSNFIFRLPYCNIYSSVNYRLYKLYKYETSVWSLSLLWWVPGWSFSDVILNYITFYCGNDNSNTYMKYIIVYVYIITEAGILEKCSMEQCWYVVV